MLRTSRERFATLAFLCLTGWWGCAKATGGLPTTSSTSSSGGSSSSSGGSSSSSGGGGGGAGGAGTGDAGACVPQSVAAHYVPLDIIFVIDQSATMNGTNWSTVSAALPAFFNDPASAGIGAGALFFPFSAWDCNLDHYKTLTVPIGVLPGNATALTSAFPVNATGAGLPTYPALQGALMQATAHQDAEPTHKVIVVLATDSDPDVCDYDVHDVASLAASALDYNGVRTHVIGLPGASIGDLDEIAVAGGTTAIYDDTINIGQLPTSLAEIRTVGLGCDIAIPTPPNNQPLVPGDVNFSYTPKGVGQPVILLHAQDLAGCNGQPGWYYDSNSAPTRIVLCPSSCATVQADTSAVVDVLFGCKSLSN